eukprot:scaffold7340_cov266-Pinguiococcus_pyrenoidosus.AAC.80
MPQRARESSFMSLRYLNQKIRDAKIARGEIPRGIYVQDLGYYFALVALALALLIVFIKVAARVCACRAEQGDFAPKDEKPLRLTSSWHASAGERRGAQGSCEERRGAVKSGSTLIKQTLLHWDRGERTLSSHVDLPSFSRLWADTM